MEASKVAEVVAKAKELCLMGLDFVSEFDTEGICKDYNGIGPQFLPPKLRDGVTSKLAIFEPAALVHDLRFGKSDGTRKSFDYANNEFFVNCHKCAKAAYKWWNWKRYRAYIVIDAMHEFNCNQAGGWRAWLEAYDRNRSEAAGPGSSM